MTDTHREWTDRLSEYMAGELHAEDSRAVEEHLGECGPCRRVLEELRDVVMRAAALEDLQPSRDLWAGIAATIQAPVRTEAKVIALPTAARPAVTEVADTPPGRWSRIVFTPPQLAAASIVLIAISAGATWLAGPSLGAGAAPLSVTVPSGAVSMVTQTAGPPEGLAEELSLLEESLVAARAILDPNTVRVLERNLSVIEMAIADSHRALAQDPGNGFLADHLERVYQRKLTYLRDAARVAEWAS